MNKKLIFSFVLTFLLTAISTAATLNVPGSYATIQAAINAASPGDDVNVADGTYTTAGFYNIDFGGKLITVRSASGNPANCIIDCGNISGRRGFYFHNNETSAATVEGITIKRGNAGTLYYGGAIECEEASPTISNCIITNNKAAFGGAIDCFNDASPVIENCIITNNSSTYAGGAIECSSESKPQIINCLIAKNTAAGNYGGAIDCYYFSLPVIINCTIADNTGSGGFGGVYASDGSNLTIRNSILWNNSDDIYGPTTVTYSCIQDNDAGTGNIHTDPLFRTGSLGNYYLSQIAAGQFADSNCVNATIDSVGSIFTGGIFTTRTDNAGDVNNADMGFHYRGGGPAAQCKLITQADPGGSGTINPNHPAPGQDYKQFSEISIQATPASGSKLLQWIDANTATYIPGNPSTYHTTPGPNGTFVITLNDNKTVIAQFSSVATYKLITYVTGGNGSIVNVDPNYFPDPNDPRAHFIPQDTNATITVQPNAGYVVKQWLKGETATFDSNDPNTYGVIPGTGNSLTTNIDADITITVEFKYQQYLLTTKVVNDLGGTISPPRRNYPAGTTVQLTATPYDGYRVKAWSGNAANKPAWNVTTNTVVMNANKSVSVQFELGQSRLIHVFGDSNGIQNAIDLAKNGDTIQIHPDTYIGTGFVIKNKSITIIGDPENPENVVIDLSNEDPIATGVSVLGFQIEDTGTCVLNGLTIANARYNRGYGGDSTAPESPGGDGGDNIGQAIYLCGGANSKHQILNCIIRGITSIGGDGGNGADGNSTIHQGSYGGDSGTVFGGGIFVESGSPVFKNCIIEDCCAIGGIGGNGANGFNYTSDTDPNNGDAGQGGLAGGAFGGGIACGDGSNPTFENCIIRNCFAKGGQGGDGGQSGFNFWDSDGYGGLTTVAKAGQGDIVSNNSARGGAVYIGKNCNAKFINCTIEESTTEGSISGLGGETWYGWQQQPNKNYHLPSFGAGVFCDRNSNTTFSNCNMQNNETISTNAGETVISDDDDFSGGGGLSLWYAHSAEVNDCKFTQNSAPIGGGIHGLSTDMDVKECNIINNNSYSGGGILALDSIVEIKRSSIKGNTAGTQPGTIEDTGYPLFGSGGGVYALSSLIDINDTVVTENYARITGGGICLDGDTMLIQKPLIKNCLITKNRAVESGGGIASIFFAQPQIQNCTIADNSVTDVNGGGGGLFCSYESDTITKDSIFWNNSGVDGSQIALSDGGLFTDMPASLTFTYSDIDLRIRSGADLSASESASSSDSGATLVNQQTIYDKINSSGSAKIIVSLAEPSEAQTTNWSSTASVSALQGKIAAQQAHVLSTLNTSEFTLRHKLTNVAAFSGTVTGAGLNKLLSNPLVVHVEADKVRCLQLAQGIPLMNALDARSTFNGQGISIAVCDTGIDYTHPRLGGGGFPNSKVIGGYDFADLDSDPIPGGTTDNSAHGTCCSGIVAGSTGTVGDYIGGVAYNAKLYALKISSDTFDGAYDSDIAAAWDWCISHMNDNPSYPIKIISTSFGGGRYSTAAAAEADSPALAATARRAVAAGITILASSGNEGYTDSLAAPAAFSSVIGVGAVYDATIGTAAFLICTDSQTAPDKVTCYSNTAGILSILAPSHNAYTTDIAGSDGYSSGDYDTQFGGTSAACPYAAGGVAALQNAAKQIRGVYLTPSQVKNLLIISGTPVTDTKVAITKPRINLGAAIALLTPSIPVYTERSCAITGLVQDINDMWTTAGSSNISEDPKFVPGLGYYLSHKDTLQDYNSPCFDIGSTLAAILGLDTYTTRIDGVPDTGKVDMGFHYTSAMPLYNITVQILPDANNPGIYGRIIADPNNLISYNPATATYVYRFYSGMTPTLTAVPDVNYFVKGWYDTTDTIISVSNAMTFTVDSDKTYFVRLKPKYTISVSGGGSALRDAVDAAKDGDELVVYAGVYDGDINIDGKKIDLHSEYPDDPDEIKNVVIDCGGNTRGFIFSGGETADTIVSGFTIINGGGNTVQGGAIFIGANSSPFITNIYINDCNVLNANGGAIYISNESNPEFSNVNMTNCSAANANGGGIYIGSNSRPIFRNCLIDNCHAGVNGGGVYCETSSIAIFSDSTFTNNSASDSGGAIFYDDLCTVNLDGCEFANNRAQNDAGAVMCGFSCDLNINKCNFTGNDADNSAGGIYIDENCSGKIRDTSMSGNIATEDGGAIYITDSNIIEIEDCNIADNTALRGGGIFALSSLKTAIAGCGINHNKAYRNSASDSNFVGQGGGIYSFDGPTLIENCQINDNISTTSGGGIYLSGDSEPNMHNCLLANNTTGRDGGGVSANWNVKVTLSNCTIANNAVVKAGFASGYGGGLSCAYDAYVKVINSILWYNDAEYGPEISIGNNFDAADKHGAEVSVSYSDVKDGQASAFVDTEHGCILNWGAGNLNGTNLTNPWFISGLLGNYYLSQTATNEPYQTADSLCVDAGYGTAIENGMYKHTTRTDHLIDIADSDVDMGYHYTLVADILGDFNFDGKVDIKDLYLFVILWLDDNCTFPDRCYDRDLNEDGRVDFEDFALFAENYGKTETIPPKPDPMTWAILPYSAGPNEITIRATIARDNSGSQVEYLFQRLTDTTSTDLGWFLEPNYTDTGLTEGQPYEYRVKARDARYNETGWSDPCSATPGNPTPPTVSSFSPPDNATAVGINANLVINFSESVFKGTGNIVIKKTSDNSTIETIAVGDAKVAIAGSQVTINPAATFDLETEYYVQIAATCFKDSSNNYYAGISNTTSWSFTTETGEEETDKPTPNPSQWLLTPINSYDGQFYSHTMTAVTANDATPPVYYEFQHMPGSTGEDSGWQEEPTYTTAKKWLNPTYGVYRVRTRDALWNIGDWSPKYDTDGYLVP